FPGIVVMSFVWLVMVSPSLLPESKPSSSTRQAVRPTLQPHPTRRIKPSQQSARSTRNDSKPTAHDPTPVVKRPQSVSMSSTTLTPQFRHVRTYSHRLRLNPFHEWPSAAHSSASYGVYIL